MDESRVGAPMAPNTTDEHRIRMVSGLVGVLSVVSLLTPYHWIMAYAAIDFFVLGWVLVGGSPLALLSRGILSALRIAPKPTYLPAKRFAARFGFCVTATITALWVLGMALPAEVITVVLIVGSALDAFANRCPACWVYSLLPHRSEDILA